jgi:nascent polypeptide-associated complex subunit alpha
MPPRPAEKDDDEMPALTSDDAVITKTGGAGADEDDDDDDDGEDGGKQNRAEKKARKALQKLGLKTVLGVSRVTIKKTKTTLFVLTKPDVFKSPGGDTYVFFGEAKIEDLAQQAGAFDALSRGGKGGNPLDIAKSIAAGVRGSAPSASADEDDLDETGLEAKDIELVMGQADVSRAKAIAALKKNQGDIVNSIMELTGS